METPQRRNKNRTVVKRRGSGSAKQQHTRRNRTLSAAPIENTQKSKIVQIFLEILTMIKLYHWKTRVYSEHKTTDDLHASLSEKFDRFVETMMGKDESRIRMIDERIRAFDYEDKRSLKKQMYEYRAFFVDMDRIFNPHKDKDLLNIRDEILADINQFLYLMSFE